MNLLVMLLETRKPVTVEAIQGTVPGYSADHEAFKRMFERDKSQLREMGIPLELVQVDVLEGGSGYWIPKGRYYLDDLALEPDEAAALWLAAGLLKVSDPESARTALLKLGEDPADDPEGSLARSWLRFDVELTSPGLTRAYEAVADRKQVQFSYSGPSGTLKRTVDPYGLVHRRGSWYLVGNDHTRGETRSFRLDRVRGEIRIRDPGKAGGDFEVPENFRPEKALDSPPFVQGDGERLRASVRFEPDTAWLVERNAPWLELRYSDDQSATSEVEVTDPDAFVSWLLLHGEGAELLGPGELRALLISRLEEICGG